MQPIVSLTPPTFLRYGPGRHIGGRDVYPGDVYTSRLSGQAPSSYDDLSAKFGWLRVDTLTLAEARESLKFCGVSPDLAAVCLVAAAPFCVAVPVEEPEAPKPKRKRASKAKA